MSNVPTTCCSTNREYLCPCCGAKFQGKARYCKECLAEIDWNVLVGSSCGSESKGLAVEYEVEGMLSPPHLQIYIERDHRYRWLAKLPADGVFIIRSSERPVKLVFLATDSSQVDPAQVESTDIDWASCTVPADSPGRLHVTLKHFFESPELDSLTTRFEM